MNTPLLEQYEEVAAGLPGSGVAWLETLRREGNDTYRSLGLPGPRVEAWKYTNLTRMGRTKFLPALKAEIPSLDNVPNGALDVDAPKLVLVNGLLRSDLSDMDALPKGLSVSPLATAMGSNAERLKDVLGQINVGHPMPMLA
ncbi:MAG: Fe-S cluster assembly protein SufD, partial [Pseudomonadota bacterium]|nr:Fe-S cluster assembly protein SufD [Pseudomonadota bacterium]